MNKPASESSLATIPLDKVELALFIDTANFNLYNNAFILRRRVPSSDPETVFKFRHPDMQRAAEMDVRPKIFGDHKVKFKAETLPLKDQVGGYRLLFSHNVEFPLSAVHEVRKRVHSMSEEEYDAWVAEKAVAAYFGKVLLGNRRVL